MSETEEHPIEVDEISLGPQPGPQEKYLQTDADIAIYGGGAGGGKTYALLLESLRNLETENFDAVIFRRTTKQITNPGALWDESQQIYPYCGMTPRQTDLDWHYPDGATVKFAGMEHEHNKYDWQGAAITMLGFDELTHFTKSQFFYMLSRNRSLCGVKPYVRATTNPDADSWVALFIAWWIDQKTGLPIPERDGVLRWFIRVNNDLIWANSKEELLESYPAEEVKHAKSVTFIRSSVTDNKILMENDPSYMANLKALDPVERARLLDGNWKIKAHSGMYFNRSNFRIIEEVPRGDIIKSIRYWDRAATKPHPTNMNPDWTVGTLMHELKNGTFVIEHVERFREDPFGNEERIKNTTTIDGLGVTVGIEQDPGQAGKVEAHNWTRTLMGYDVRLYPVHKDKVTRAKGYSAQVRAGNVYVLKGEWNEVFFSEHESFPPEQNKRKKVENSMSVGKDDQVDSGSGAFNHLTGDLVGTWTQEPGNTSSTITSGFFSGQDQW